jgi:hypothetical protein
MFEWIVKSPIIMGKWRDQNHHMLLVGVDECGFEAADWYICV